MSQPNQNFSSILADLSLSVKDEVIATDKATDTYKLPIYDKYFFTIRNPTPNGYFNIVNDSFTSSTNFITADNMAQGCFRTGNNKNLFFLSSPFNLQLSIASGGFTVTFSYPTIENIAAPPPVSITGSSIDPAWNSPAYTKTIPQNLLYFPYVKIDNDTKTIYTLPYKVITNTKMSFYSPIQGATGPSQLSQISGAQLCDTSSNKDVFIAMQWASNINPYSNLLFPYNSARWLAYSPEELKNVPASDIDTIIDITKRNVDSTSTIGLFKCTLLSATLSSDKFQVTSNINGAIVYIYEETNNFTIDCGSLPKSTTCVN